MKSNTQHKLSFILLFLLGTAIGNLKAQDSTTSTTVLSVHYFLTENGVPYLEVSTQKKTGRKFEPLGGIPVNVYFRETVEKNLLGKLITASNGKGRVGLPASFKAAWDSANEFKFIAVSDSSAGTASLSSDITIKKAMLVIDATSADGIKTVTAQLKEKKANEWVPVKEIEMKLGIKRTLGNLTVGEAETYTSDSTGMASAVFKLDSMPGDLKGNLVLVARVEDNDDYGNLVVEKTVPWGVAVTPEKNFFDQRTLWSTRLRTPVWLLFMVYSIIIGVWGTIIYLLMQIVKIKKLGAEGSS